VQQWQASGGAHTQAWARNFDRCGSHEQGDTEWLKAPYELAQGRTVELGAREHGHDVDAFSRDHPLNVIERAHDHRRVEHALEQRLLPARDAHAYNVKTVVSLTTKRLEQFLSRALVTNKQYATHVEAATVATMQGLTQKVSPSQSREYRNNEEGDP
jgi:hypothetical protein